MNRMELFRKILRENKMRFTEQRRLILEVMQEHSDKHLSVEEIHRYVSEKNPAIGLATIYRTMDSLLELNMVYKLDLGDKGALYELRPDQDCHYHHHLFCRICGAISEFDDDDLDELEERITREHGFKIEDHALRFYGICKECLKRQEEEANG